MDSWGVKRISGGIELSAGGATHLLSRIIAGICWADTQHHALVVMGQAKEPAEAGKKPIWVMAEEAATGDEAFFRLLSETKATWLVAEGYCQTTRWAWRYINQYYDWIKDHGVRDELYIQQEVLRESDQPASYLISVLERTMSTYRRRIHPSCEQLADSLSILRLARGQAVDALWERPVLAAFALGLSGLDFYGGDKEDKAPVKSQPLMAERVLRSRVRNNYTP